MNIKFSASDKGNNKGSCIKLVEYLNKENQENSLLEQRHFFSAEKDQVSRYEVIDGIDGNNYRLSKNEAKFYMVTLSPSQKELEHINCCETKLRNFTREIMEAYAQNFGKGLSSADMVWFAKIEENRMNKKTKEPRPGLNWHIHVIVSRRDKSHRFKLSPLTNHRGTRNGPVSGGFDRNALREKSEEIFDQLFKYKRAFKHSFLFQNTLKNGANHLKEKYKQLSVSHPGIKKENVNRIKGTINDLANSLDTSFDDEIRRKRKINMDSNREQEM